MEPAETYRLTEKAYLEGELNSDIRHEYIDGYVYAMVDSTEQHNRLTATLSRKLGNALEGLPCDAYPNDFKVKVGRRYYYPDVVVKCDHPEDKTLYTEHPLILIEVTSKSTHRYDREGKLAAYKEIKSLQEYLIVEQHIALIEIHRRCDQGWRCDRYRLGDVISLQAIDLKLTVEEIYERIDNADVKAFLAGKKR
ncbi:Uma2 family endonuclease [Magnetococcales bacterium HHB-1]